jgi:protein-S-isoprenylcysteine O-methyltransferase Ste14
MNLISEPGLGIFLLVVLSLQGGVMLACTGRFPQIKPERQGIVMMENCFNTAILLLFIPLISVLLLTGYYPSLDLTRLTIGIPWLIYGLEAIGISLVLYGTALVVFGLLALRKTFQPGGFAPRSQDRLITWRIYSFVRHPLNAGVLAMGLRLWYSHFS